MGVRAGVDSSEDAGVGGRKYKEAGNGERYVEVGAEVGKYV